MPRLYDTSSYSAAGLTSRNWTLASQLPFEFQSKPEVAHGCTRELVRHDAGPELYYDVCAGRRAVFLEPI